MPRLVERVIPDEVLVTIKQHCIYCGHYIRWPSAYYVDGFGLVHRACVSRAVKWCDENNVGSSL